jgi:hypothetical protein
VRARPEIISVVGGGWSVSQIDLARIPGEVIAVNDSAVHLPRVDVIVSMDRLWTEYRFERLRAMEKVAYLRRSAVQNVISRNFPWLHIFDCDHTSAEFSDRIGWLNGTNSGLCGFNLAYQARPNRIVLFGFDMKRGPQGQPYWHEPYPWSPKGATKDGKYASWAKQFAAAKRACDAAGIEVRVVGDSAIECFPKLPLTEFRRVAA